MGKLWLILQSGFNDGNTFSGFYGRRTGNGAHDGLAAGDLTAALLHRDTVIRGGRLKRLFVIEAGLTQQLYAQMAEGEKLDSAIKKNLNAFGWANV